MNKTRIAVQKSGRLREPSLEYLAQCGLEFEIAGQNLLVPCLTNPNVELLLARNSDIPTYLYYGVADYGIVGQNTLLEQNLELQILKKLDFGNCQLVIAVPENSELNRIEDLANERIATSYPQILKQALSKENVNAAIIEIKGAVEACPAIGLADAIFDITQTGRTIKANNLRPITTILDSQAVLIKNSNSQYENLFV